MPLNAKILCLRSTWGHAFNIKIKRFLRKTQKYWKETRKTRKIFVDLFLCILSVAKNFFWDNKIGKFTKAEQKTIKKTFYKKIQRNWEKIDNAQNFAITVDQQRISNILLGYVEGNLCEILVDIRWFQPKRSIELKRSTEIINKLGQSILGQPQITFALKCFEMLCMWLT